MTDRRALNSREVAARLGHTLDWFYRNRARLERENGFPAPIGALGHRWDSQAIDAWLDRQGAGGGARIGDGAPLEQRLAMRAARLGSAH